ncbi:MAG TPA: peptide ABC transporter substrate-binding protein [Dehalococcoidia bacterium]|nr:peptide ABC transporter substrate-binding protein [Dehalococcoidia bacterium]
MTASSRTRWPFFIALVLGAAVVAIVSYFILADRPGEAVPASGGHYVEGVTQAPDRINPLFASANQTDADLASLIFSGLVRLGPDGTPQPELASRWEITGNGQSYVFHLRQGVEWQDGEPFTADDVVFTFHAIADPAFKGDAALAALMQGVVVTARDPLTVEFRLDQAYAPFLSYLTVGILPRHLLDGLDANQLYNAPFNSHPVGTGPYAFDGSSSGGVTLTSNPTYYLGPPKISTFEFRVFPDRASLLSGLRSGSVDGAYLGDDASQTEIDILRQNAGLVARKLTGTSYDIVYLDTQLPIFSDAAVRRALRQAVNVDALLDAAGIKGARPTIDGVPQGSWAGTKSAPAAFDPGAAASALEVAGWSRRSSDGVRVKDGNVLSFTLSTSNDPAMVAMATELARQWRVVGAEAKVQPLDAASFVSDSLLGRNFQAALAVVSPGADPDPYPFWHSSQAVAPGRNLASFSDPDIDDILERARQTTDTARRQDLYAQFENLFIADAPSFPLFSPPSVYVQTDRVHGFSAGLLFTPASRFSTVASWYIDTRIR